MQNIVQRLSSGRSSGKFKAIVTGYKYYHEVGIYDTEIDACGAFECYEPDVSAHIVSPNTAKEKKISIKEWKKVSRAQVTLFSKKYQ